MDQKRAKQINILTEWKKEINKKCMFSSMISNLHVLDCHSLSSYCAVPSVKGFL
jgi:hypothetical protein